MFYRYNGTYPERGACHLIFDDAGVGIAVIKFLIYSFQMLIQFTRLIFVA